MRDIGTFCVAFKILQMLFNTTPNANRLEAFYRLSLVILASLECSKRLTSQ